MIFPKLKSCPHIIGVMTPFPHEIQKDDSLDAALKIMDENEFHHLPVMDRGSIIGVVTRRDIELSLSHVERSAASVLDVCSAEPYVVDDKELLSTVLKNLVSTGKDVAFVMRDEKLVGIFTAHDAFRILADMFDMKPGPIPDQIA